MQESEIYYIQLNLQWVKVKENTIQVIYSNGLRKISKEYKIGEDIKTIINLQDD